MQSGKDVKPTNYYQNIREEMFEMVPTDPKQYKLIKLMGGKRVEDMRYEQIATLAQIIGKR